MPIPDNKIISDFNKDMMEKLVKNQHKAHWNTMSKSQILRRIMDETEELAEAIILGDKKEIIRECADIANFCLFMVDNIKNEAQ